MLKKYYNRIILVLSYIILVQTTTLIVLSENKPYECIKFPCKGSLFQISYTDSKVELPLPNIFLAHDTNDDYVIISTRNGKYSSFLRSKHTFHRPNPFFTKIYAGILDYV